MMATLQQNVIHMRTHKNYSHSLISQMENTGFEPVTSALQGAATRAVEAEVGRCQDTATN